MNPFEKPQETNEERKKAIESLEEYAKKKLEAMSPEERGKFKKGREEVRKTRRPEPQL